MTPDEIIPDSEIEAVHAHANFGDMPKREVVNQALLRCACGYHNGHTALQILHEHDLVRRGKMFGAGSLTNKGRKYLYAAFSDNSL